jgi:hypothetical protein
MEGSGKDGGLDLSNKKRKRESDSGDEKLPESKEPRTEQSKVLEEPKITEQSKVLEELKAKEVLQDPKSYSENISKEAEDKYSFYPDDPNWTPDQRKRVKDLEALWRKGEITEGEYVGARFRGDTPGMALARVRTQKWVDDFPSDGGEIPRLREYKRVKEVWTDSEGSLDFGDDSTKKDFVDFFSNFDVESPLPEQDDYLFIFEFEYLNFYFLFILILFFFILIPIFIIFKLIQLVLSKNK